MSISKVMSGAMAGMALLSASSSSVYAASSPSALPHAYYVAEFEVTDPEGMKPYSAHVESTFKPYGGHFIVRGGKTISLEGDAPKRRRVVIEFDSVEKAQAWYNSPEYTELRKIRQRSAKTDVYLIEGVADK
ncbi:DUF1330 domain-containing protein [Pseudomonas syringae]|uniref:DUF1330 domain-containing protein n=1 Tax=Pseudomonas syringae pv. daphniphylli TaxID=264455 RepID=A0A9X0H477_PSESX|nr:DUF1330 domain-containing protein [Pseudomonas syringae]KPX12849.1 hypothetical protein ALO73_200030 [Pseudomonas syringae pv. daphniphylli]KWS87865.1 hypothetical protein AL050_23330 [Pseudomonas syringae pv. daphniphylli]